MTGEQIEKYIREELDSEPKHDCEALSEAINDVAYEIEFDSFRIMQLLLENKPIDAFNHGIDAVRYHEMMSIGLAKDFFTF